MEPFPIAVGAFLASLEVPMLPTGRAAELPPAAVLDLLDSAGAPARSGDPDEPARHDSSEPLDRSAP